MADDIKTSFFDFIKERTTTPLWANFILSWIIFNWHVLIWVFFSGIGDAQQVINNLSKHEFKILTPFLLAVAMTAFVPAINTGLFYAVEWFKIKRVNIRNEFSGQQTYTSKQYDDMVAKYLQKKEEFSLINSEKTTWEADLSAAKQQAQIRFDEAVEANKLFKELKYETDDIRNKYLINNFSKSSFIYLDSYLKEKGYDFKHDSFEEGSEKFKNCDCAFNLIDPNKFVLTICPKNPIKRFLNQNEDNFSLVTVLGVRIDKNWHYNIKML